MVIEMLVLSKLSELFFLLLPADTQMGLILFKCHVGFTECDDGLHMPFGHLRLHVRNPGPDCSEQLLSMQTDKQSVYVVSAHFGAYAEAELDVFLLADETTFLFSFN